MKLEDINTAIQVGEQLRPLKKDKTKLSLYLANLYYKKAERYTVEGHYTGFVDKQQRKQAFSKAKAYYNYYLEHTQEQDDTYRAARNGIAQIDEELQKGNY